MATEEDYLRLVIDVNAGQAEADILRVVTAEKKLEAAVGDLTRAEKAAAGASDLYSLALAEQAERAEKATFATKSINAGLGHVAPSLGSAGSGFRNTGMAALEFSRAVEDVQYGLNGVINNIPGLVMALGGTMGLTAVISLAAVAVNQLVKHWGDIEKLWGGGEAKAAVDRMEELAAKTHLTAEEQKEYNKLKKEEYELDKLLKTKGTAEDKVAAAATAAIKATPGGGPKVIEALLPQYIAHIRENAGGTMSEEEIAKMARKTVIDDLQKAQAGDRSAYGLIQQEGLASQGKAGKLVGRAFRANSLDRQDLDQRAEEDAKAIAEQDKEREATLKRMQDVGPNRDTFNAMEAARRREFIKGGTAHAFAFGPDRTNLAAMRKGDKARLADKKRATASRAKRSKAQAQQSRAYSGRYAQAQRAGQGMVAPGELQTLVAQSMQADGQNMAGHQMLMQAIQQIVRSRKQAGAQINHVGQQTMGMAAQLHADPNSSRVNLLQF